MKKMDPKLVASKQQEEIRHISKKYNIPYVVVKNFVKVCGRSRAKLYAELRKSGYVIKTRRYK